MVGWDTDFGHFTITPSIELVNYFKYTIFSLFFINALSADITIVPTVGTGNVVSNYFNSLTFNVLEVSESFFVIV